MRKKKIVGGALIALVLLLMTGCGGGGQTSEESVGEAISGGSVFDAAAGDASGVAVSGADAADGVTGESAFAERSREFAEQIVAGLYTPVWEAFSVSLANELPEESLQASWNSVAAGLDGYQGIERVDEEADGEYEAVTVTLRYQDNQGRSIRFIYEGNDIVGIWFDTADLVPEEKKDQPDTPESGEKFVEEDIIVGRSPYELDGRMTYPAGTGGKDAPVVILFSDEGSDKDGTIGAAGNTPLRDIAHGLAEEGIASLRFNTRRYQYPTKISQHAGIYEMFLEDACFAVDQMSNQAGVNSEKIYLAAMGDAADWLPALVEKKESRLAGAVLMGAKPVKIEEYYYADLEKNVTVDARYFMEENSTISLLILQGDSDFVTTKEDFEQWKEVCKGRSHVTYHNYEKLNHYLIKTHDRQDAGDYDPAGHVSAAAIEDIAKWCLE